MVVRLLLFHNIQAESWLTRTARRSIYQTGYALKYLLTVVRTTMVFASIVW